LARAFSTSQLIKGGAYQRKSVVVKVLLNNPTPHNSNHGGTEITEKPIRNSVFSVSLW
jgi:hypothetical protein